MTRQDLSPNTTRRLVWAVLELAATADPIDAINDIHVALEILEREADAKLEALLR